MCGSDITGTMILLILELIINAYVFAGKDVYSYIDVNALLLMMRNNKVKASTEFIDLSSVLIVVLIPMIVVPMIFFRDLSID